MEETEAQKTPEVVTLESSDGESETRENSAESELKIVSDPSNLSNRRKNSSPVWQYFLMNFDKKEATCAQPDCNKVIKSLKTGNAEQHLMHNHEKPRLRCVVLCFAKLIMKMLCFVVFFGGGSVNEISYSN